METTRSQERGALDARIAASYDASGPHDDDEEGFGEAGPAAAGETLGDLRGAAEGRSE